MLDWFSLFPRKSGIFFFFADQISEDSLVLLNSGFSELTCRYSAVNIGLHSSPEMEMLSELNIYAFGLSVAVMSTV